MDSASRAEGRDQVSGWVKLCDRVVGFADIEITVGGIDGNVLRAGQAGDFGDESASGAELEDPPVAIVCDVDVTRGRTGRVVDGDTERIGEFSGCPRAKGGSAEDVPCKRRGGAAAQC